MLITAVILLVLLCFSAVFAGSETALFMVLKDRSLLAEEKKLNGEDSWVLRVLVDPSRLLMTVLLGNLLVNLVFFALSTFFVMEVENAFDRSAGVLVSVFFLLLVIIFGEIAPKTLASVVPLDFARKTAWLIGRVMQVLSLMVDLLTVLIVGINRLFGIKREDDATVSSEDLQNFVDVSGQEGWLEGMHGEVMVTVMELHQLQLKSVRTPRVDVVSVHEDTLISEVKLKCRQLGVTLIPLYNEHHDDIQSYIDSVRLLGDEHDHKPAKALAYPLPVFSDLSRMDLVLRAFLQKEHRLALTVNEYGEMSGLVTWNDVMKCLRKKVSNTVVGPEQAVIPIDGRTNLRDLPFVENSVISREAVTLAGYISSELERIPLQGEQIELLGVTMVISRANAKGVKEVLVVKKKEEL